MRAGADAFLSNPAELEADYELEVWRWWVRRCVHCGRRHCHGGGRLWQDPRGSLGARTRACGSGKPCGYMLTDSNAARTEKLIREVRAVLPDCKRMQLPTLWGVEC